MYQVQLLVVNSAWKTVHEVSERSMQLFSYQRVILIVNINFFKIGYFGLEDKLNFAEVSRLCLIDLTKILYMFWDISKLYVQVRSTESEQLFIDCSFIKTKKTKISRDDKISRLQEKYCVFDPLLPSRFLFFIQD